MAGEHSRSRVMPPQQKGPVATATLGRRSSEFPFYRIRKNAATAAATTSRTPMMYLFAENHDWEVSSPPLNTTGVDGSELCRKGSTGTSSVAGLAVSAAGSAATSIF